MKKIRLEKGNLHRNPIFQKRGSCHLDNQRKNEGRTVSPHCENHQESKSMFQNMKT